jgi:hypothetical protein
MPAELSPLVVTSSVTRDRVKRLESSGSQKLDEATRGLVPPLIATLRGLETQIQIMEAKLSGLALRDFEYIICIRPRRDAVKCHRTATAYICHFRNGCARGSRK